MSEKFPIVVTVYLNDGTEMRQPNVHMSRKDFVENINFAAEQSVLVLVGNTNVTIIPWENIKYAVAD